MKLGGLVSKTDLAPGIVLVPGWKKLPGTQQVTGPLLALVFLSVPEFASVRVVPGWEWG